MPSDLRDRAVGLLDEYKGEALYNKSITRSPDMKADYEANAAALQWALDYLVRGCETCQHREVRGDDNSCYCLLSGRWCAIHGNVCGRWERKEDR